MHNPATDEMYRVRLRDSLLPLIRGLERAWAGDQSGDETPMLFLPKENVRVSFECLWHLGLLEDARRLVRVWRPLEHWFVGPVLNEALALWAAEEPSEEQRLKTFYGWFPTVPEMEASTEQRRARNQRAIIQARQLLSHLKQLKAMLTSTTSGPPSEAESLGLPWEGDDWDELTPLARRLLQYMHGRDRADLDALCPVVWGRDYTQLTDSALHSAIHKANAFLSQRERRTLEKVRGEPVLRWV